VVTSIVGRAECGCSDFHSPSLALLIDHDDAEHEFQYISTAGTVVETEPITDIGARLGWTIVSMARDWDVVFPQES
jgi:hypothetical protein